MAKIELTIGALRCLARANPAFFRVRGEVVEQNIGGKWQAVTPETWRRDYHAAAEGKTTTPKATTPPKAAHDDQDPDGLISLAERSRRIQSNIINSNSSTKENKMLNFVEQAKRNAAEQGISYRRAAKALAQENPELHESFVKDCARRAGERVQRERNSN